MRFLNLYYNVCKILQIPVRNNFTRSFSLSSGKSILGIETSCDDTGCAVLNGCGDILGEAIHSQTGVHVRNGGVIKSIATNLHRNNIERIVNEALLYANKSMNDIDVIAVTVKPGMFYSLKIGVQYAKHLSRTYDIPLVPIHHMEAHALVSRMFYDIPFPFLCLLISGGHCLLSVVRDVDDFLLLGHSLDASPGVIFDRMSRELKLKNIKKYSHMAGGKAIEMSAKLSTNPNLFQFKDTLAHDRDCNFSFNGILLSGQTQLAKMEMEHNIVDGVIPKVNDFCAAFQSAITAHIVHRTKRALIYCQNKKILSTQSCNIVVSGGVACNDYIFNHIAKLGEKYNAATYRPPQSLCTDNGVMIAWNGIEKIRKNYDFSIPYNIEQDAPLGRSVISEVKAANIYCIYPRINEI